MQNLLSNARPQPSATTKSESTKDSLLWRTSHRLLKIFSNTEFESIYGSSSPRRHLNYTTEVPLRTTMSTMTDVRQDPVATVFNITELLEKILLCLDSENGTWLRTLLLSQRVSKRFQAVIEESTTLQQALYFSPTNGNAVSEDSQVRSVGREMCGILFLEQKAQRSGGINPPSSTKPALQATDLEGGRNDRYYFGRARGLYQTHAPNDPRDFCRITMWLRTTTRLSALVILTPGRLQIMEECDPTRLISQSVGGTWERMIPPGRSIKQVDYTYYRDHIGKHNQARGTCGSKTTLEELIQAFRAAARPKPDHPTGLRLP
jgi:hypothetical protein